MIYVHTRDGARAVSISRAPIIFLLLRLPPDRRGWSPGQRGLRMTGKGFDEARGRWPTRSKYGDVKSIKRANSRYCKSMCTPCANRVITT